MQAVQASQPHLYLASASPRRHELLKQVGLHPVALPQQVDERPHAGEAPADYVRRIALAKSAAALQDPCYKLALPVLAADTSVVCDGTVLGKPASLAEATTMLHMLAGRSHQVLTAVSVANERHGELVLVSTEVHFRVLHAAEITAYWHSGEPRDKAGAYAIQGLGAMFVSRIEGSYSAVVGLPLFETLQLLAKFGISCARLLQERAA
jgi:septum formation protein